MIILGRTSTMSSHTRKTVQPILCAQLIAYVALSFASSAVSPRKICDHRTSMRASPAEAARGAKGQERRHLRARDALGRHRAQHLEHEDAAAQRGVTEAAHAALAAGLLELEVGPAEDVALVHLQLLEELPRADGKVTGTRRR